MTTEDLICDMAMPPAGDVRIHIYASRSTLIGPVYAQMEAIRANVALRNGALGVNTALLHQSGWFVQWLEGPAAGVQQVLARIAGDTRHGAMHVLHDSLAPRQLLEPWSMAVVHAQETPDDFARRVARLAHDAAHGRPHTPAAVWRLLSTPLTHAGAHEHEDSSRFCRTMVCAADVDESFDLVRWLGRKHGVEVVRRRFAGTDTPDVETDYVDFVHGAHVHRVIAMARNGIRIGLTRAFMADYGCVVILRGEDARRNAYLLQLLVDACAPLWHRPALVGVGGDARQQAALRQAAQQRAMAWHNVEVDDRRDPARVWDVVGPVARGFASPPAARSCACG